MKKNTKTLLPLIFFLFISSFSFSQNFIWARGGIGSGGGYYSSPYNYCVTNDEMGDVYTAGAFIDHMQFGTTSLTSFTLELDDVFISKYDVKGNLKWVIQDGGTSEDVPNAICYYKGYIYVAGGFEQTATFGTTTFHETTGIASAFIVKYDTAGNFIWAKAIDGNFTASTTVYIFGISADDNGNIIMGGMKYGSATILFDTIPVSQRGGFTAKFNSDGNALWVSMGICIPGIRVNSVVADHAGNYYSTGSFGNDQLGSGGVPAVFGNYTIYTYAYSDIFLVKYNSAGVPLWAKRIGDGWYTDEGRDLAVDSLNNIYIAGYLDYIVYGNHWDFMIAKCDTAGNLIWMKNTAGASCSAISSDRAGNIYFTGLVYDTMTLNNDTINTTNTSIMAGKLDCNGNTIWITRNSNTSVWYNTNITAAPQGNSYVTGGFTTSACFGQDLLMGMDYVTNLFVTMLNDSSMIHMHNNLIKGNIYNDLNSNCIRETGEENIPGFSVMAQPGNIFAVTDSNGNYSLKVDSGTYSISQLLPVSHSVNASQVCPALNGSYTVHAFSSDSTYFGNDFADHITSCPVLDISFGYSGEILCDIISQTNISVNNYGSVPAYNTQLKIVFSSAFVPVSSSPAWSSYTPADTTLIFNLGTLPAYSFTTVTIDDSVTCLNPNYEWIFYFHFASITPVNSCTPSDTSYCVDTLRDNYFIPIGLSNIKDKKEITVYPNPTGGRFNITGLRNDNQIEIYDIIGRLIDHISSNENTVVIDLGKKDKGIYIIRTIDQRKEVHYVKILLQ